VNKDVKPSATTLRPIPVAAFRSDGPDGADAVEGSMTGG
jgi:hypothetical protein